MLIDIDIAIAWGVLAGALCALAVVVPQIIRLVRKYGLKKRDIWR